MKPRTIVQSVLFVVIIALSYFIYESIMKPVRFNKEDGERRLVVIERLKDIRTAQLSFKSVNGRYTGSFDTLLTFLKTGKIPVVKKIGTVPDSLTEAQALKKKIISRDTSYVNAGEELFRERLKENKDFKLDELVLIPLSKGDKFEMQAGFIEKGKVRVPVFMVIAPKKTYLVGLNEEMINMDYVKDLQLGSMTEPSTDGNWE